MDPRLLLHCIVAVNSAVALWELYLVYRQRRKHASTPKRPSNVESIISEEDYVKARSYSLDHLSFMIARMVIEGGIMIAMLYSSYYYHIWQIAEHSTYPITVFLAIHYITAFLLDLPLSLYANFIIEELHGFNKYTISFFIFDSIKKLLLTTAITIPLSSAAVWLMENSGDLFFIYLWLFVSVVILCMMTVYPAYIAPLFDQYSPLPDGELKRSIEELAAKLKYPLTEIYVVDGSTRSGHSNAYLFGFWNNKRIVLYDTLLSGEEKRKVYESFGKDEVGEKDVMNKEYDKGMGIEEARIFISLRIYRSFQVVAVIGHELGHWALGHSVKNIAVAELNILLALFCFSFFHNNESLAAAFGFTEGAPALVSLLVIMQYVMGVYNELSSLLTVCITRRMEFEADAFAAELGLTAKLRTALIKLGRDNLSVPVNDYWYSLCNSSHPSVPERIDALKKFN